MDIERRLPLGKIPHKKEVFTLPVIEVPNKVVWVNQDFPEIPFDIELGKHSNLGVFMQPAGSTTEVEVTPTSNRSGLITRAVFKDRQGNLYRDVNLKGIGGSDFDFKTSTSGRVLKALAHIVNPRKRNIEDSSFGICDKADALVDANRAEELYSRGIRTDRTIAIIELEGIVHRKETISIKEAKERGYIQESETPVVQVRAYGTKARMRDVGDAGGNPLMKDAMHLVAQELGVSEEKFTFKAYTKWFAKTLGTQMALLHLNGYIHGNMSLHNVTLDCRLTDFDTVRKVPLGSDMSEQSIIFELIETEFILQFLEYRGSKADFMEMRELFWASYKEEVMKSGHPQTQFLIQHMEAVRRIEE